MNMLHEALAWHDAGYAPLPLAIDGSKKPWVDDWHTFTDEPPTREEIAAIFSRRSKTEGIGLLCGAPSGGLEMLEFEGRAITEGYLPKFIEAMNDNGLSELWNRINTGYVELTPSHGMHWYYRVEGEPRGNTRIARRPSTEAELAENPSDKVKVLIETRGQGGFTVIAPSAGSSHPTGHGWTVINGSRATLPTITEDERDALHAIGSFFDTTPVIELHSEQFESHGSAGINLLGGTRPGDDFNTKARWEDILDGWVKVHSFGGNAYGWRRPGKNAGISATTGRNDGDNLYVFSTSTEFESERAYSKFAAYALLKHRGDFSAAAKALSKDGYGTPPPITPATPPPPRSKGHLTVVDDGSSARVLEVAVSPDAAQFGPTEDGTARMLVAAHSPELRFCPQRGEWLTWNGHRWEWDAKGQHREFIKTIARELPEEQGWGTYKKRALSASGVSGIARLAATDPAVVIHIDELDAKPYELNTPGGIIDLRSGTLRAPDPAALHTRVTAVTPDFDATSDVLDKFLADTFPDEHLRTYMARLLGLSVIGEVLENVLPFGYGVGANGKTTLYEAVSHALGTGETGYAMSAPSEMLMQRRHSEHPAELAQLVGARIVVCSELDDGQKFAEARVKMLTGGDSINARFMRRDPFTFRPSHTLHLLGNHKPSAATGGPAFWRRVQLIPFDHVVPVEQRDGMLGEKLADAAPAVLAWLARGAAEYISGGLRVPSVVNAATADYAADQDTIGRFVADECHRAESSLVRIKVGSLRDAYEKWCIEMGETPVSAKRLTSDLAERFNVGSAKSNGVRWYTGITVIEADETDPDDARSDNAEMWR